MVLSFFAHLSFLSAAIPFLFGFFRWKNLTRDLKLIVLLAALSLAADSVSLFLATHKMNTWPVSNVYLLVQSVLLFYVLSKHHSLLVKGIFYACITFGVINFLFLQGPRTFDSYTTYLTGVILICTALYFFYVLMKELPAERVQSLPLFWIAIAVLVYYGGTIFVFLFNNYILTQLTKQHPSMWVVHNVINTSKNMLFFIALWVSAQQDSTPDKKNTQ